MATKKAETGDIQASDSAEPGHPHRRSPSVQMILLYRAVDNVSGVVLAITSLFAPWAFGTTQPWSIWTMNGCGYLLVCLLFVKLFIREHSGHVPARWGVGQNRWANKLLAGSTFAILSYILVSALNARADYHPLSMEFSFREHLNWLPHSYDRAKSWQIFFNYLALAGYFWSLRDWLLGKSLRESAHDRQAASGSTEKQFLPERLRKYLWLLCVNGSLLAVEALAQRLHGGDRLLWLVEPRINREAVAQLGPYAYRANGAQYFNLLWPAGVALWWILRREARQSRNADARPLIFQGQLLFLMITLMVTCPLISTSRGGAVIAIGGMFVAATLVVTGLRRRHPAARFASLLLFASALAVGLYLGWDQLSDRLKSTPEAYSQREQIFATARKIVKDYPVLGTGPGSFESVFQLYRSSPDEYWPAQLHNDWLETLITFGWFGSALIAVACLGLSIRWFVGEGVALGWRFPGLLLLGLVGCLFHARFDFPLQVYSILHLFLSECAVLSMLSFAKTPP